MNKLFIVSTIFIFSHAIQLQSMNTHQQLPRCSLDSMREEYILSEAAHREPQFITIVNSIGEDVDVLFAVLVDMGNTHETRAVPEFKLPAQYLVTVERPMWPNRIILGTIQLKYKNGLTYAIPINGVPQNVYTVPLPYCAPIF